MIQISKAHVKFRQIFTNIRQPTSSQTSMQRQENQIYVDMTLPGRWLFGKEYVLDEAYSFVPYRLKAPSFSTLVNLVFSRHLL